MLEEGGGVSDHVERKEQMGESNQISSEGKVTVLFCTMPNFWSGPPKDKGPAPGVRKATPLTINRL